MMAVLRKMGCEVGVWTKQELSREDAERVKKAARKNKEGEKEQRKVRRRRTVKLSKGWTWKVCIGMQQVRSELHGEDIFPFFNLVPKVTKCRLYFSFPFSVAPK